MSSHQISFRDFLCLNNKFLIYNLVIRNLKLRYRKSYIGILWTLLIPAANALIYNLVFKYIMKVDIPNYLVFLLSGLLPWGFFLTSVTNGMETLVANQAVLNKIPINAFTFILAETLTALTNFVLGLPIVILMILFSGVPLNIYQLLVPFLLLLLFLQAYGLSVIFSYLFVYFRDLRHLMGIVLQIWFYLTPILYQQKMIPANYEFVAWLNPLSHIFNMIHLAAGSQEAVNISMFIVPVLWTGFILYLAISVVRRYNQEVVESL
jgi:lipopolysaccharide transport system permease protein